MAARTKRTYNLSPATVHRIRELAEIPGVARTQDEVVELAVERLYLDVRAREEAAAWEEAAADPSFGDEMARIAWDFARSETSPE